MYWIAQIAGWLLVATFAICAINNLIALFGQWAWRGRDSGVPFIGGLAGMAGGFLLGWPWTWCLACLVIDISCVPMLVASGICHLRHEFRRDGL